MVKQYYLVQEEFDPTKDYGIIIRKQYAQCLATLKKDDKVNPHEFVKTNLNRFTSKPQPFVTNRYLVYHSFTLGKKIGILRPLTQTEKGYSISFADFCKLESVSYFMSQLRTSRFKNLAPKGIGSTAEAYTYRLWHFDQWIHGKEFEFTISEQDGKDVFRRIKSKVTLRGVEHLLELYKDPYKAESEFSKIIKGYLLDPIHKGKRQKTMKIDYVAIKSYFEKNDYPLNLRIDLKNLYRTTNGEDEQPSLSLEDVMKLLTVGRPTITQKAAFLCKLHRGLDNSTLIDRFNFQAWEQLIKYFEIDDYSKWDLKKCPVPIQLTRMKTDYTHVGYLDRDAIMTIQEYLEFRRKKTGREMRSVEPLFISSKNEPINEIWIRTSLRKLLKNAGLDKKIGGYMQARYKINPHEFRDLLKSTLIECGTRYDVADHCIGHKPRDSYEKQISLYSETARLEYAKASHKLNIFSSISTLFKRSDTITELERENSMLKAELARQGQAIEFLLSKQG